MKFDTVHFVLEARDEGTYICSFSILIARLLRPVMGVPSGGAGCGSPPDCWANMASRAIFFWLSGKCLSHTLKCTAMNIIVLIYYMIKLYYYQLQNKLGNFCGSLANWQPPPWKILAGTPMRPVKNMHQCQLLKGHRQISSCITDFVHDCLNSPPPHHRPVKTQ